MIVSFDLYTVISTVNAILSAIFLFCLFYKANNRVTIIIKLVLASICAILHLIVIPIDISLEKGYTLRMVAVCLWIASALISSYQLGRKNN